MKAAVLSNPHEISAEQIVQLYKHAGVTLLAGVANAAILATFLWPTAEHAFVLGWFALVALTGAMRVVLARAYAHPEPELLVRRRWLNRHMAATAAAGLAWGAAAIILYPDNALPQQVFLVLMLGGAAASALPTFAALPQAYVVYMLCVLGPAALRLTLEGSGIATDMALVLTVFAATLTVTARSMHVGLMDSLRLHSGVRSMAHVDALTGVHNRRHFDEMLVREWNRAKRSGVPLSILMIDVDHFKGYNDRYGHQAGDSCLKQVARALAGSTRRAGDLLARYGGEEFVMLLYHTPRDDAYALAEKLRNAITGLQLPHEVSEYGHVSISAGGATAVPGAEDTPEELLRCADRALYDAKRLGRNRVAWLAMH